ncbi:MAG: acyl dehydratase [Deltaproteobacteria bacterium]|nr:acyl dehydratase [Deltaproteobacteria bacterium]
MKNSVEFHRRPSVAAYMLRSLTPSAGLKKAGGFPPVRAIWRGHRVDRGRIAEFLRLAGLRADRTLPMLYPHVFGFQLQMVIITHPAFPIRPWNGLQIRNRILQRRPIPEDAVLDMETRVACQRILEKGAEVDLHTTVRSRDELMWESINTYYYRGRFGEADPVPEGRCAPEAGGFVVDRWRTRSGTGWRMSGFTGDYNGIHYWDWYARRFGFPRALHHPQLILGQCMARLRISGAGEAQRLETWLKGPVFHDSDVNLFAQIGPEVTTFQLITGGEKRPAILGRWNSCAGKTGLLEENTNEGT